MGTTSSAPARDSRGDLRQRAAQQAWQPRYAVHPAYANAPQPFQGQQNYAAPRYYGQAVAPPLSEPAPAQTERTTRTTTIRNHVNLKKDSLALRRDETSGGWTCRFVFDANLPCWVSVFAKAKDAPRDGSRLTLTENRPPPTRVRRDAGLGQTIAVPLADADADALLASLDARAGESSARDPHAYALIVRLECVVDAPGADRTDDTRDANAASRGVEPPEPAGSPLDDRAQAQTTFASVSRGDDDASGSGSGSGGAAALAVSVLKQKIWVDGVSYELQEIFGIEHCSTGTPLDEGNGDGDGDSGKECVICMSEPRDTTALPCRHLCMCGACARMLRGQSNRCPICRTPVESLLEIKVATKDGA